MEYGTAVIVGELGSLELSAPSPGAAGIYDQPIGLRLLYADPGSGPCLFALLFHGPFDVRLADGPHD